MRGHFALSKSEASCAQDKDPTRGERRAMDFWQTVQVVFRRWYITFPAFLGALGLAGLVYGSVTTQYVSTSVLLLTSPRTGPTQQIGGKPPSEITNPLLNFDRGLSLSATMLIQNLTTPEAAVLLGVPPGGDTWYQVTNGSSNPELLESGPFVFIEGTSVKPQDAQDIIRRVSALAAQELAERQTEVNAPPSTYITVNEIVPPTTPEARKTKKLRAAGAAGMLGMFGGLAAGFAFESIANRQKLRRIKSADQLRPEAHTDEGESLVVTSLRS